MQRNYQARKAYVTKMPDPYRIFVFGERAGDCVHFGLFRLAKPRRTYGEWLCGARECYFYWYHRMNQRRNSVLLWPEQSKVSDYLYIYKLLIRNYICIGVIRHLPCCHACVWGVTGVKCIMRRVGVSGSEPAIECTFTDIIAWIEDYEVEVYFRTP